MILTAVDVLQFNKIRLTGLKPALKSIFVIVTRYLNAKMDSKYKKLKKCSWRTLLISWFYHSWDLMPTQRKISFWSIRSNCLRSQTSYIIPFIMRLSNFFSMSLYMNDVTFESRSERSNFLKPTEFNDRKWTGNSLKRNPKPSNLANWYDGPNHNFPPTTNGRSTERGRCHKISSRKYNYNPSAYNVIPESNWPSQPETTLTGKFNWFSSVVNRHHSRKWNSFEAVYSTNFQRWMDG